MRRRVGFLLLGAGLTLLAWLAVTVWRGDPITSTYTRYEQHRLTSRLGTAQRTWDTRHPVAPSSATPTRQLARTFGRTLRDGDPIGRIVIPRLHLRIVVVEGTSESDLTKGPGHYDAASGQATGLPGMGRVIGIAGHRTTYLHPFRHIDDLQRGDRIYLVMPYGTFQYTVVAHRIVGSGDWSILRRRSVETLVLSACHPLYSASHRWIVFARLTRG